jgi:hypothetical protein
VVALVLGREKIEVGVRLSLENFEAIEHIKVLPLYGFKNL